MADFSYTQGMGHDGYAQPAQAATQASHNALANLTNLTAAAVSLGLVVGVALWGYNLMMRDVSGIPVVRAAAGEMRVRPENPGGQLALNQGLSVNQVAADGGVAQPADRLTLAPQPVALTHEDQPQALQKVAAVQQPVPVTAPTSAPAIVQPETLDLAAALERGSVESLVNQLTAGAPAIDATPVATGPKVVAAVTTPRTQEAMPQPVVLDAPGLRISARPKGRPTGLGITQAVVAAVQSDVAQPVSTAATPAATRDVDPSTIPAGTRLVQLGAFDSAEVAKTEWSRLQGRFADYLQGKSRVVQKAQSGGRTFYRLRAMGFEDLSAARQFCSALLAEKADCIPVVTR